MIGLRYLGFVETMEVKLKLKHNSYHKLKKYTIYSVYGKTFITLSSLVIGGVVPS